MKIRITLFSLSIILILSGFPVYSAGFEDVSLGQIIFKLIAYLLIFIFVILLTLYGTRLIGKNFKGMGRSKYINILDAINLPGGSKLVITKVNQKVYLLGVNNSNINVIDIIEENEFPEAEEEFHDYLTKFLDKNKDYNNPLSKFISGLNNEKDRKDEYDK